MAVAAGMKMITDIAEKNNMASRGLCKRLTACLDRYRLNAEIEPTVPQLAEACLNDKKRESGSISIIICSEVGKSSAVKMPVPDFLALLSIGNI